MVRSSAMDLDSVWPPNTTTVYVTVFIVALGILWMYVMAGRGALSASGEREYKETVAKGERSGVGKRGARSRGKGKAVSDGKLRRILFMALFI